MRHSYNGLSGKVWRAMETRNEKIRAKTAAVRAWLVALLPALATPAQGLQVEGFTSAAVQEAVSRASAMVLIK